MSNIRYSKSNPKNPHREMCRSYKYPSIIVTSRDKLWFFHTYRECVNAEIASNPTHTRFSSHTLTVTHINFHSKLFAKQITNATHNNNPPPFATSSPHPFSPPSIGVISCVTKWPINVICVVMSQVIFLSGGLARIVQEVHSSLGYPRGIFLVVDKLPTQLVNHSIRRTQKIATKPRRSDKSFFFGLQNSQMALNDV